MKQLLRRHRLPFVIIALTLLIIGTVLAYRQYNRSESVADSSGVELDEGEINYNPPTEEEIAQAEANKDKVVDRVNTENQAPGSGKKSVTPNITYAQQVEQEIRVNAYIAGVFESGGVCTFTFTNDNNIITKTANAEANVTTTDCARLAVSRSEFPVSGDWQVKVRYQSPAAEGESSSSTVMVN
jgi:hypothetical protein